MDQEIKINIGKQQVNESTSYMAYEVRTNFAPIKAIQEKNEEYAKKGAEEQEKKAKQRQEKAYNDALDAQKINNIVDLNLYKLKDEEEPEQLDQDIKQQKKLFGEVQERKIDLIGSFENELKFKETQYINMLKEQDWEMRQIIVIMRDQFDKLRNTSFNQMNMIEEAFCQQRENTINHYQEVLEKIFKRHKELESQFVEDNEKQEEVDSRDIELLRIKGHKDYADLKITMETEIQSLEKCYEDMKALYQLNTEKLDYNLKVLGEKKAENATMLTQLKHRDQYLGSQLRNLVKEHDIFDKQAKRKNQDISKEYKRVTKQFKQLQEKFKHFEHSDSARYTEIQRLNEQEVSQQKLRILKCDRVIHQQQLGIGWINNPEEEDEIIEQPKEEDQAKKEEELPPEEQFALNNEKLTSVLDILMDEMDFLVDETALEYASEISKNEYLGKKLDLIKASFQIDSLIEFNMFLERLMKECRQKSAEEEENEYRIQLDVIQKEKERKLEEEQKDNDQAEQQKQPQQVQKKHKKKQEEEVKEEVKEVQIYDINNIELNRHLIVDFLVDWMQSKESRKKEIDEIAKRKGIVKQETEREKKQRMAREGQKYWSKLTQVLPESTFRVWKVLDKSLSKYYTLLQERQLIIDDTGDLHTQNEELKGLLGQYLQINHELIIPPTRLINLEASKLN